MTPNQAHNTVHKAVKEGRLAPSDACELCGTKGKTVGHHYNGWDKPLDVWYICYGCNSQLRGYHDGSLTQEQARELIAANAQARRWIVAFQSKKDPNLWYSQFQGNETQARKYYQKKINQARRAKGIVLLNPLNEVIEWVGDSTGLFD